MTPQRPGTRAVAATTALLAALTLAACGSSSSSSSSAAASSRSTTTSSTGSSTAGEKRSHAASHPPLALAADPSGALRYNTKSLTAKAGLVTIRFTNTSPLMHNVTIQQGTSGRVLGRTPTFNGGTKTLTVALKPGKYTFLCSVIGHRMAGMHGTLTITS